MTGDLFESDADQARARVEAEQHRREAVDAELRKAEADFTPPPVAWAVVDAALECELHDRGNGDVYAYGPAPGIWPAITRARPWPATLSSGVAAGPRIAGSVVRVLDINAGAGVWSMAVRRWAAARGIKVHITAVEYRESERAHLERNADVVIIADWHEAFGMVLDAAGVWVEGPTPITYDLVLGNPAFSQARAQSRPVWEQDAWDAASAVVKEAKRRAKAKEPALPPLVLAEARAEIKRLQAKHRKLREAAVGAGLHRELAEYDPETSMPAVCLRYAPALLLYLTSQTWTKTASGFLTRIAYPHALAWDIPGSISHRGLNPATGNRWGADDKPYTAFCWLRGHEGPAVVDMLEPLDGRSWTMRPGTEDDAWRRKHGIPTAPGNDARADGLGDA